MTYQPRPIDTTAVTLPDELLPLTERLAEHAHDVWAQQRLDDGWTDGPRRDDDRKEHPCLVPYDALPESEKQYDRNAVLETLKAIVALGYRIVKDERRDAGSRGPEIGRPMPAMNPIAGELVPAELVARGMKAEIQVRTILQHAWAEIDHELSYKNRFKLPRTWQREFARLAAVLEKADRDLEHIRVGLEEYAFSYGAYLTPERLREEIETLSIVLEDAPREAPAIAHQLAKMAMSLDDWDRAIAVLLPFADDGPASLVRDLGISLCKRSREQPEGPEFARGQEALRRATERNPTDVDAFASLAGSWRTRENAARDDVRREDYRRKARENYRRAFEIDPTHPYPLGNWIEYEMTDHPDVDIVGFFRTSLEAASRRCQSQADVGVNLPWAYFDLGKFQLMLRRPYEALWYYAQGVEKSSAASFLDSALSSFTSMEGAHQALPGLDWSRGFLQLAKAFRFRVSDPAGPTPTAGAPPLRGPVVIVAGYCGEPATEEHRTLLKGAFRDFDGTILSGGTEAGISGLVGELQATCGGTLRTIGYVPARVPPDVPLDVRYTECRRTMGTDFSPLEPLQYWADLLASGIPADQIRLLALGGGRIAASECLMALAFGVPVGVVEKGDSEASRYLAETPWALHPRLQRLRAEPGALVRFLMA